METLFTQSLGLVESWRVIHVDPPPSAVEKQGNGRTGHARMGAWFNYHRLLGSIGYIPPAEAEANNYRQLASQATSAKA